MTDLTVRSTLFPYTTLFRSIFAFSYKYSRNDKPVSSVTIDLGDSSRQILVRGESADKVRELSLLLEEDRKSTRLNSSHSSISYAVFCLKKKILNNTSLSRSI